MGRFIDLRKEYNSNSYMKVISLMKRKMLPLLEPVYYFNDMIDVNGNKIENLFLITDEFWRDGNYTKSKTILERKDASTHGEIYSIINQRSGKRYIGQSENVYIRKENHVSNLLSGTHVSSCLQSDFFLLGDNQFVFEILESVKNGIRLKDREQELILEYGTEFPNGYNSPVKGNKLWATPYKKRYSKSVIEFFRVRTVLRKERMSFLSFCENDYIDKRRELIKRTYRESNNRRYFFNGFSYVPSWFPITDDIFQYLGVNKEQVEKSNKKNIINLLKDRSLPDNFKKVYYYWIDFMNRNPCKTRLWGINSYDDPLFLRKDKIDEFEGLYDD